ncbi:hypothetical protein V5799_007758 [Amblyomma americanum]|uniref:Uncharacterized protein n=1 Tax=Amblyomma americanum TaxID=6943 RepID=A0AAQ4FF30_AMBAM
MVHGAIRGSSYTDIVGSSATVIGPGSLSPTHWHFWSLPGTIQAPNSWRGAVALVIIVVALLLFFMNR